MAKDQKMEEMQMLAIEEILRERTENGFPATSEDELRMAVDIHVQKQIKEAMLYMFYRGELEFTERDGGTMVGLTEKGKKR